MNLKLLWTNLNTVPVTVKVYRSDTPIDTANLPAPLATLAGGEVTYTDPTAVRGKFYYYVFESITANDRVVSQNYRFQAVPRLGPGPNELKYGDPNLGYFGSVMSSEFINTPSLRAAIGLTAGTIVAVSPTWHKFIRNGTVLFIPNTVLVSTITWNDLYLAGAVFGVNSNGNHQNGQTPTNQRKTVTIGPDTFLVRLMKGYSDDITKVVPAGVVNEPEEFVNEYNDLVYPLVKWVPNAQRLVGVSAQNIIDTLLGGGRVITQDQGAGGTPVTARSQASESRLGLAIRGIYSSTTGLGWLPVLELLPSGS